jgi:hypothetical protein
MNSIRTGAILVSISGGVLTLHAQPAAIEQLQNQQLQQQLQTPPPALFAGTNAPELYTGENADVGPQRILRLNPRPLYFDVLLDSQVFYSDNANYAQEPAAVGSAVFVNTAQATLTPPVFALGAGKAAVAVGLASQWYNYGHNQLENLDFDAETVFLSGKYTYGNWQIGAGINLTRLVSQENYNETYREFMPNLGVQRVIPVNEKMFFALGDLVDYHVTRVPSVLGSLTDINDRLDNVASLTFTWQALPHLLVQPYYRFQYSYYQHDSTGTTDRNDYLQSLGLTAAYYFNQKVSVRAFYNYNRKQTSDPFTPAYLEMNGGVGLTLDIKF